MALRAGFQQSGSRSPERVHRTASGKSRSRGRSARAERRAEEGDRRPVAKAIEKDSEKRTEIWHKGEQAESRDERIPARLQVERLTTAIDGHFDEHREIAAGTLLAELPPQVPETMREENTRHRGVKKRRWSGE